jgi:hypothetical protein
LEVFSQTTLRDITGVAAANPSSLSSAAALLASPKA